MYLDKDFQNLSSVSEEFIRRRCLDLRRSVAESYFAMGRLTSDNLTRHASTNGLASALLGRISFKYSSVRRLTKPA
jgi:hypothetical protein